MLQNLRAPDLGDFDVLAAVLPAARKRGMKTICWFEDVWSRDVPNVAQAQEKQLDGQNADTLCFNNPNYRNWLLGTVEDYTRSWEIDGIMWGSERHGAFSNMTRGGESRRSVTCFCQFCEAKARERGINVERARAGFRALGESHARRQASGGWLLRHAVAADAALSRACSPGRISGTIACAKPTRRSTPR